MNTIVHLVLLSIARATQRRGRPLLLALAVLVMPLFAAHAQSTDPEWPCIQVLVPEIVTAVMWPEVIPEENRGLWKEDPDVARLARKLGDLERYTDTERELVQEFVDRTPENLRLEKLNLLADGIVSVANERRKLYISGIKRYTRQQIAIALQIEDTLNLLGEMQDKNDAETLAQKAEVEETLQWHERVYDQREHAIIALCERPVELEEVLSDVVRDVASHIPY
ncbi:MAG: hypothetical protein KTR32_42520 [Granulosicoccus sp.]|nr:hypothetical protein [Granulosicoccus sp.]